MNIDIIRYPLSTEKAIRKMESDNTLVFVVDRKSNKLQIKKAIEELYSAKVISVKTIITNNNKKKAYIRFSDDTPAIDIATKIGLM